MGLAFVTGYRYYQSHQDQRAFAAAAQFDGMAAAIQRNDESKARQIADGLVQDYPGSPYADQAQLALASLYVDHGEDANAVAPLRQVMDRSKDDGLRHVARLRLARVLIDQGKPDEALSLLSADPGTFAGRYHEVRGDAYHAKHDVQRAAEEYKAALADTNGGMDGALLTLKIADLGLPPAPATAAMSMPPVAPAAAQRPKGAAPKAKP